MSAYFSSPLQRYLRAAHDKYRKLYADREEPRSDETFVLEPHISQNNKNEVNQPIKYGELISIKCLSNSMYVRSEKWDNNKTLSAEAPHKKPWESFTLIKSPQ